jgi:hypothetical protein
MADEIPLACCLSDEELRNREATLIAEFKSAVVTTEELADGYLFHIPSDKKSIAVAAELIVAERECCPFLRFELAAEPGRGPVTVRMTGQSGTKEFLKSMLLSANTEKESQHRRG